MTCPASTRSPSRTVISRIRPLVLAATAESSPSIRPLTAITPGGSTGPAKKTRQTTTPAAATTISSASPARARRRRPRAGGCSLFGGAPREPSLSPGRDDGAPAGAFPAGRPSRASRSTGFTSELIGPLLLPLGGGWQLPAERLVDL